MVQSHLPGLCMIECTDDEHGTTPNGLCSQRGEGQENNLQLEIGGPFMLQCQQAEGNHGSTGVKDSLWGIT